MSYAKRLIHKFESDDVSSAISELSARSGLVVLDTEENPLFYQEYNESTGKYSLWIDEVESTYDSEPDYSNLTLGRVTDLLREGLQELEPSDLTGELAEKLKNKEVASGLEFIDRIKLISESKLKGEASRLPIEVDFTVMLPAPADTDKAVTLIKPSFDILKITDKMIGVILRSTQDVSNSINKIKTLLQKNSIKNPEFAQ